MDLTNFNESFITAKMPNTEDTMIEAFLLPTLDVLIEVVKEWEGDWTNIIEKLQQSKLTFAEKVRGIYSGKNDRIYSVLNHCDFHFKNMMFMKDENKIKELLLVRFNLITIIDFFLSDFFFNSWTFNFVFGVLVPSIWVIFFS